MKDEYDFSKAERGKFYNPKATISIPLYLDSDIADYFSRKAKAKGVDLNTMVNELLKKDIDLIEGIK